MKTRLTALLAAGPACGVLAGVHGFTEEKATVWAGEGLLSVHAHESGPLRIDVGRKGAVKAVNAEPL